MSNFQLVREHRQHGEDIAWCKARIQVLEEMCKALESGKQDRRGRKPKSVSGGHGNGS